MEYAKENGAERNFVGGKHNEEEIRGTRVSDEKVRKEKRAKRKNGRARARAAERSDCDSHARRNSERQKHRLKKGEPARRTPKRDGQADQEVSLLSAEKRTKNGFENTYAAASRRRQAGRGRH